MKPAPGMLSLSYHLAFDPYYRHLWNDVADYAKCFSDFGITDTKLKKEIKRINKDLGTADPKLRDRLVDEWLVLVGDNIKASAANPKILW